MTTANKFEIHYFLKDGSHSMDATDKNKCEAEFLAVAYEIIDLLDLGITLNAEALREGGVKDVWEFIGKNSPQFLVICAVLTALFAYKGIPDAELTGLKKENLRLENKKLKEELSKIEISEDVVEAHIKTVNENQKVVTRRSNFYRILNLNEEVQQVGFSTLDKDQKPLGNEIVVQRPNFLHFIQRTNKLPEMPLYL